MLIFGRNILCASYFKLINVYVTAVLVGIHMEVLALSAQLDVGCTRGMDGYIARTIDAEVHIASSTHAGHEGLRGDVTVDVCSTAGIYLQATDAVDLLEVHIACTAEIQDQHVRLEVG